MYDSNASVFRYTVTNLVIPSIAAASTTEVQVILQGAQIGDIGFAMARDAKLTNGLGLNGVRISAAGVGQLQFVNGSAGAIDAPDTFDFDVVLFRATGALSGAV